MDRRLLLFLFCFNGLFAYPQKKDLTLNDLVDNELLKEEKAEGIYWMKDEESYTRTTYLGQDTLASIVRYEIESGTPLDTVVNINTFQSPFNIQSYTFSRDEKSILLVTGIEPIYRRSYRARYYIYNIKDETLNSLSEGKKVSYATFSPDGRMVAYTKNNDLYYTRLDNYEEYAITTNGKINEIINGSADWVYEEELRLTKAFFWSPDSEKISYYTFDERKVPLYNMQIWDIPYPRDYRYKYPKAGEANSIVTISIHNIEENKTVKMDTGPETDIYIPHIQWTSDPSVLSIRRLSRLQNRIEIIHSNTGTGKSQVILKESTKTYIDINRQILTYLSDNSFLYSSDRDGNHHIYHHDFDGQLINQVTKGPWEVTDFYGLDESKKRIYYASTEVSPLERHVYSIRLKGSGKNKLSLDSGMNNADFSQEFEYYLLSHESLTSPPRVTLRATSNTKLVRTLTTNDKLVDRLKEYKTGEIDLFNFRAKDNTLLNGYIILPPDFDSTKVYPLLMYVYGGPGSQRAQNTFKLRERGFHTYLTSKGMIIACVDNRGTGGRGRDFKNVTYKQLGRHEVEDQLDAARYLGQLDFINANSIGIWGKSYGGYMSALCLFEGRGIFKYGISVAPVTHWRLYDTIYTERYMQRPNDNPDGYMANNPLNSAYKLEYPFLLIHGTSDDNVHIQNSIILSEALKKANKPFFSIFYQNKTHALRGKETRLHLYSSMESFILDKQ